ncbi:phytase [Reichenbachiella versicolor]|uniref:phytase n=1 Tax=Reichenbachiella versicolor TaxID=1821036 RepID=UPI000D6E32EA|nr:phytase [Reichenbachiella versicolor]
MRKILFIALVAIGCQSKNVSESIIKLKPKYTTSPVQYDSDDPAIWINPIDPAKSLILGTDKYEDEKGGIYVFDLEGKSIDSLKVKGVDRPNNIDILHGVVWDSVKLDIAVFTERGKKRIRVYQLPEMKSIDGGGIPVFEDSDSRAVMGVALSWRKSDSTAYAIVSRKGEGSPANGYLYQYKLNLDSGKVSGELVRKFGKFSGGHGEIEAIAVDDQMGYIYYSDEWFGIRKYYVDPAMGDEELASFGLDGFKEDREGISIYSTSDSTGYILVSDQQANVFRVFPREGTNKDLHEHPLIKVVPVSTNESDGSEVSSVSFNSDFPNGLFVAMSDDKTFQIYDWDDIQKLIDLP